MTLTPQTLRIDLKCGKGAISQGEKCHKGTATTATNQNNTGLTAGNAIAATAAGGAVIGAILSRKQWTPTVEKAFKEAVAVLGHPPLPPAGSKFLAKGYAGAIYKAKDGKSVFKINFKRNIDGRRQFEQELATQAQLHDKGINTPNVLAVDRRRSIAQIEFLDGYKNLTDIAQGGSSSEKKRYAKQFLVEMSKLHKAGYSHSDMHLGNVMVKDGDVKLIDWGYAVPLKNAPRSGMRNDMQHIEYMLGKLDTEEQSRFKELLKQTGLKNQAPSRDLYARFWNQFLSPNRTDTAAMPLTPSTLRIDLKCGKGSISSGEKCHKGNATTVRNAVGAGALALGLTAGAVALARNPKAVDRIKRAVAAPFVKGTPGSGSTKQARAVRREIQLNRELRRKAVETSLQESNERLKNISNLYQTPRIPKPPKTGDTGTVKARAQTAQPQVITSPTRPKSVFAAFKEHAMSIENAKPIKWDKKNNFIVAENELGSKFAYTLTPEGMWVSLKVGKLSDEVDFQLSPYNNAVPASITKEGAENTFNRMSKMFIETTKDLPNDTFLWTTTDQPSYTKEFLRNQLGTNALSLGTDPSTARTKLYEALGFKFDPESGEVGRTLGDVRKRLSSATRSLNRSSNTRRIAADSALRIDLKCGKGSISSGEKCHKGPALSAGQIAGAAALTLGAGALTAYALTRGKKPRMKGSSSGSAPSPKPSGPSAPRSPRPSGPARLPGAPEPYGLLPPGRRPKSKTQRMHENTQAAMRQAEGAIGQTAREEVRRIAQIGNTMASVGEATGMATKTALREVRLRTEAARRRFEPGYRRSPAAAPQPPAQLAPGNEPALDLPFNPAAPLTPESVPAQRDPRTGQPKRRRPRGFGPRRDSGLISFSHPVYIDPAR